MGTDDNAALADLRRDVAALQAVLSRSVVLAAASATATLHMGEQIAQLVESSGQPWSGRPALNGLRVQLQAMMTVMEEVGRGD